MQPKFGIYEAIVTDNSNFFHSGKIKVRIQSLYNGTIEWDLSNNYNKDDFDIKLKDDVEALIQTSVGGGLGYGLFVLPQINSKGTVQFLGGNVNKPIWTGAIHTPEYDQEDNVFRVGIPNDNPSIESSGILKTNNDSEAQKQITGDFGTIIFRQKSTSKADNATPDNMDWQKQSSENLIIVDKDQINITHFNKWENNTLRQKTNIILGSNKTKDASGKVVDEFPEIKIQVEDVDTQTNTGVIINNEETDIVYNDTKKQTSSKVSINSEGITSEANNDKNNTIVIQNPEKILFNNDKTSVLLEKKDIALSAPTGAVRLSGGTVLLGEGGGYIVTSDKPMVTPMKLEDGTILVSSKCKA